MCSCHISSQFDSNQLGLISQVEMTMSNFHHHFSQSKHQGGSEWIAEAWIDNCTSMVSPTADHQEVTLSGVDLLGVRLGEMEISDGEWRSTHGGGEW